MLETLKELVKHYAGEPIINNPAIPNERNEEAVHEASSSILDGLKKAVSGGDLSGLTSMFSAGEDDVAHSPVAKDIQGGFVENMMHKFGLDQGQASNMAGTLIPAVLKKLVSKTKDPSNNNFDLSKMLEGLSGGATGEDGLVGKVKGFFK